MNESLSITNLEAERLRRQVYHIVQLARSGKELPVPKVSTYRRGADINLGGIKVELKWTSRDGDPEAMDLYVSRQEVEEKLYALFKDKDVTKILYKNVFKSLEAKMGEINGTVTPYGNTKFCG